MKAKFSNPVSCCKLALSIVSRYCRMRNAGELTFHSSTIVWLQYAVFEELDTEDYERARDVYKAAIKLIPHKQFTFAKVGTSGTRERLAQAHNPLQLWTAYALFEIRRLDLNAARKVMGTAIGLCPKPKLFTNYIQMEIQLREFDRCRTLYQKFLEVCFVQSTSVPAVWIVDVFFPVRPQSGTGLDSVDDVGGRVGRSGTSSCYLRVGCTAVLGHARGGLEGGYP